MGQPAARLGDSHDCHKHGGKEICEGSSNININDKPAVRKGDKAKCKDGQKATINSDCSSSVTFNGHAAAMQGSKTDHDSKISSGSGNVMIGKSGNPVNIGSKGSVNIGGNGNPVNIGK